MTPCSEALALPSKCRLIRASALTLFAYTPLSYTSMVLSPVRVRQTLKPPFASSFFFKSCASRRVYSFSPTPFIAVPISVPPCPGSIARTILSEAAREVPDAPKREVSAAAAARAAIIFLSFGLFSFIKLLLRLCNGKASVLYTYCPAAMRNSNSLILANSHFCVNISQRICRFTIILNKNYIRKLSIVLTWRGFGCIILCVCFCRAQERG